MAIKFLPSEDRGRLLSHQHKGAQRRKPESHCHLRHSNQPIPASVRRVCRSPSSPGEFLKAHLRHRRVRCLILRSDGSQRNCRWRVSDVPRTAFVCNNDGSIFLWQVCAYSLNKTSSARVNRPMTGIRQGKYVVTRGETSECVT